MRHRGWQQNRGRHGHTAQVRHEPIAPVIRQAACLVIVVGCFLSGCAGPRSATRSTHRAAYSAYIRGLMLERTARLPAALDAYQMALEYDHQSPQLHVRLGATYVKLGQPDRALEEFELALDLNENHVDALRWVAMLYTSQGKLDEAVEVYTQLLTVQPEDRFILSTLADLYVLQGKLELSIEMYRRLIMEHGPSSQLHFNLGVLLGRLGQFNEALVELSRALERSPESLDIRVALGLTFELQESYDKAAAHYEAAIRRDSLNPRLYHHAARAYANAERYQEAVAGYQAILDLRPNDLEAVMGVVRVWIAQKQFDRAEALLAQKLEAWDHPPELYVVLGILYREAEHAAEAIRAFERAVTLRDGYAQAHFYLAAQLDQLGQKDAARARLHRTIELDERHADALNYLGYLDADAGVNLEQAKHFIERALQLDPANGAYMDSLGWVYFRMGRLDEAVETLERAVVLLKTDAVIFDHLGDVYAARGEVERARVHWERVLELDPGHAAIREKLDRLPSREISVNGP